MKVESSKSTDKLEILCETSTDKLEILCETIKDKILNDELLKQKVIKIDIEWDSIYAGDGYMVVPRLSIEFKKE